jgi:oligopeptide/dipeptide ABC transporter ATP-binding protein
MSAALLDVENLSIAFETADGRLPIVSDLSFAVGAGEAVGIVGESGSGKSLSMLSVLRLLPASARLTAGRLAFDGRNLPALSDAEIRNLRGREIAMIFQDPLAALNPVLTIGRQISEVVRRHFGLPRRAALERAQALLASVGVPDPALRLGQYPHQFSGGMRQRVMIAMALAGEPRLLIADEPTTALDVTVQAEIVGMIKRLQADLGMTIVWVTHDLALLTRIATRVLVMYAGRIVEDASTDDIFARPRHPYTKALLASIPGAADRWARALPGRPPDPSKPEPGCPFAPRCPEATDRCRASAPALTGLPDGVRVACWNNLPGGAP